MQINASNAAFAFNPFQPTPQDPLYAPVTAADKTVSGIEKRILAEETTWKVNLQA